jgi:hypothetical protein
MKHLTYILLALFATCAHAGDTWEEPENQWAIAALGAETLAFGEARGAVIRHNHEYDSSFVGPVETPTRVEHSQSIAKVNAIFAASTLAGYLIADALPHPYRKAFLQAATVVEVSYVAHEMKIGVKMRF